ncbi:unnamed protein product [Protopolystoma xenopodis]|uniref:Uncharacterized protein n=1 Tax=Protopolystoma xenopodis TaxID=117903 RepID=A0A3S5FHE7_9PLAT|nr:unnamed protein product [Protopolystoma xenopodis]
MADIEYYAVTNAWLLHERCVRNVVLLALRPPKAGWLAIEFKTSLNVEVFMNRISCGLKAWSQRSISSEMGGLSFVNSLQSKDNRN